MRVLLDTHIALWAVVGSKPLAPRATELILAADDVFVSTASLLFRIPAELAHHLALREGGSVEARLTAGGAVILRTEAWSRNEFAAELDVAREAMPMAKSVIDELRRLGRAAQTAEITAAHPLTHSCV